jgi:hypothetical protein
LNCKFEFRTARGPAKVIERRKRVTRQTNPGSAGAALGAFFLVSYRNGIGVRTLFLGEKQPILWASQRVAEGFAAQGLAS